MALPQAAPVAEVKVVEALAAVDVAAEATEEEGSVVASTDQAAMVVVEVLQGKG